MNTQFKHAVLTFSYDKKSTPASGPAAPMSEAFNYRKFDNTNTGESGPPTAVLLKGE